MSRPLCPPVLLIIFNRPDTARRVAEAVLQAGPQSVYIAADGSRADRPDEVERCKQTRAAIEEMNWPCEVRKLYQQENLGCGRGPVAAINWFFEQEEMGIILEDDCLPYAEFFSLLCRAFTPLSHR